MFFFTIVGMHCNLEMELPPLHFTKVMKVRSISIGIEQRKSSWPDIGFARMETGNEVQTGNGTLDLDDWESFSTFPWYFILSFSLSLCILSLLFLSLSLNVSSLSHYLSFSLTSIFSVYLFFILVLSLLVGFDPRKHAFERFPVTKIETFGFCFWKFLSDFFWQKWSKQ